MKIGWKHTNCVDALSQFRVTGWLAVAMASLILVMSMSGEAGESDYILVDRMPEILGKKKRLKVTEDTDRGLRLLQEVYWEEFEHAWIQTFVLSASCLDGDPDSLLAPHIIAVKYLPKKPANFTIATLHDIYKEVYVDADDDRIRPYEDVSGHSMLELSERYLPRCVRI